MRRILSFVLVTLFAASLVIVAGSSASAQDKGFVAFKGYVMAGTGMYDDGDTSDLIGESEAQIEARGGEGPVTARYRLRVRDSGVADLAATRHNVTWKVSDNFELKFDGAGFGDNWNLLAYGQYTTGHFGSGMTIGDLHASEVGLGVNWAGVDATFKTGAIQVGVRLNPDCRPSCGSDSTETMTIYPHFYGTFGALTVSAFAASASGTSADVVDDTGAVVTEGGESLTASSVEVDVVFKAGQMTIAGAIQTGEASDKSTNDNLALSVNFGPIRGHYVTNKDEPDGGGDATTDLEEITVAYTHKLTAKGELAFGYATRSDKTEGGVDQSLAIVSAKTNW